MTYTEDLARYVTTARFEALPPSAISAAKRITLDTLGVTLAARRFRPGQIMGEYVRGQGGRAVATVLGTDIRTSPSSAALANGTMAADMEQDDVHPEANLHASSVFLPAILGVAEERDSSGRDLITALTTAYDVGCRLSIAMDNVQIYVRGFHPTAVAGTFGAAAGVSSLLRLDADTVVSAFGLTGCQAAGLLTWEMESQHFTKSFQSGVPARNAVTAVELAAAGFLGAADTLDGEYNVFDSFSGHRNFARLVEGLGERYEIEHTGYKFYSCCRGIHSALDAVLENAAEHGFGADDVESIAVRLPTTVDTVVNGNTLITHNLQHCVAAALIDGEVSRAQTTVERFRDPEVQSLASRIDVQPDEELQALYPKHWPAHVTIRLTDGRELVRDQPDPRGSVLIPVSDDVIAEKFTRMADGIVEPAAITGILKTVSELEHLGSVRELTALLAVSGSA